MEKYTSFSDVCRLYWDKELVVDQDDDDLDDEEEEFLKLTRKYYVLFAEGLLLGLGFSGIYSLIIELNPVTSILSICAGVIGVYTILNFLWFREKFEAVFDEEVEYYDSGISANSYSKKPALFHKFVNNIWKHPFIFGLSIVAVGVGGIFGSNDASGIVILLPLVFYLWINAKLSIKLWW